MRTRYERGVWVPGTGATRPGETAERGVAMSAQSESESARDEHGRPEGPEGAAANGSDGGPSDAVQEFREAPRQPRGGMRAAGAGGPG